MTAPEKETTAGFRPEVGMRITGCQACDQKIFFPGPSSPPGLFRI